jgi:hypothetical protein
MTCEQTIPYMPDEPDLIEADGVQGFVQTMICLERVSCLRLAYEMVKQKQSGVSALVVLDYLLAAAEGKLAENAGVLQ